MNNEVVFGLAVVIVVQRLKNIALKLRGSIAKCWFFLDVETSHRERQWRDESSTGFVQAITHIVCSTIPYKISYLLAWEMCKGEPLGYSNISKTNFQETVLYTLKTVS